MDFDKKAYDKQYLKKWRLNNPEYQKAYYQDNRDCLLEQKKAYYQDNIEHIKTQMKKWLYDNPEYHKAYDKKWYQENAEYKKAYCKQYAKDNPEKIKTKSRKRRALKNGAVGYHTEKDLQYIYEQQKGKCVSCRSKTPYKQITVDHIQPLSKGGSDLPFNIQLLCKSCNSSKGNHHTTDYREFKINKLKNESSIRLLFDNQSYRRGCK